MEQLYTPPGSRENALRDSNDFERRSCRVRCGASRTGRRKSASYIGGMTSTPSLQSISDDALLKTLSGLVGQSRRVEAELIAHIAEVDQRRLYAREACSSVFASNCTLQS